MDCHPATRPSLILLIAAQDGIQFFREEGHTRKRFEFGPLSNSLPQWLLLDCQELQLYAGPRIEVLKFLRIFRDQNTQARTRSGHSQLECGKNEAHGGSSNCGGIKMLHNMVAWLDRRQSELKSQGKWPRIDEIDDF